MTLNTDIKGVIFVLRRILALVLALLLTAVGPALCEVLVDEYVAITEELIVEYGYDYYTPEEVALYLHAFWELPPNYLTKREACDIGWEDRKGNLWDVAYGLVIGGDRFRNREGLLPDDGERQWYECDVNYYGGYRGAERVVFSSDGLIYYTFDHYETFELIYDCWFGNDDGSYVYDDSLFLYDYYGY